MPAPRSSIGNKNQNNCFFSIDEMRKAIREVTKGVIETLKNEIESVHAEFSRLIDRLNALKLTRFCANHPTVPGKWTRKVKAVSVSKKISLVLILGAKLRAESVANRAWTFAVCQNLMMTALKKFRSWTKNYCLSSWNAWTLNRSPPLSWTAPKQQKEQKALLAEIKTRRNMNKNIVIRGNRVFLRDVHTKNRRHSHFHL